MSGCNFAAASASETKPARFPGGYAGVDVFFVISGFLITSLLIKELRQGTFSLLNFWERRARRILPALAAVTAAVIAAGWFILLPADYETLGKQVIALIALSSNIKFWLESGYFATEAELKPLLHTWSLSLEEQLPTSVSEPPACLASLGVDRPFVVFSLPLALAAVRVPKIHL